MHARSFAEVRAALTSQAAQAKTAEPAQPERERAPQATVSIEKDGDRTFLVARQEITPDMAMIPTKSGAMLTICEPRSGWGDPVEIDGLHGTVNFTARIYADQTKHRK